MRGEEPFDISRISSFRSALLKAQGSIMSDKLERERELGNRVRESSKEELLLKISLDAEAVRDFRKITIQRNREWEAHVRTYKSKRYNKGLTRVGEKMEESFCPIKVDNIAEMVQHINAFRGWDPSGVRSARFAKSGPRGPSCPVWGPSLLFVRELLPTILYAAPRASTECKHPVPGRPSETARKRFLQAYFPGRSPIQRSLPQVADRPLPRHVPHTRSRPRRLSDQQNSTALQCPKPRERVSEKQCFRQCRRTLRLD